MQVSKLQVNKMSMKKFNKEFKRFSVLDLHLNIFNSSSEQNTNIGPLGLKSRLPTITIYQSELKSWNNDTAILIYLYTYYI